MPNEESGLHAQAVAFGPFICDILICITLGEQIFGRVGTVVLMACLSYSGQWGLFPRI
uniref:Uncharacterized protein n=1 Tax=Parascaris equorum TaxID=6256 RepID=A0A914RHS7_PAREQ